MPPAQDPIKPLGERSGRISSLNLPPEWIVPQYAGRSILNIAATVVKTLGGQISTPPLDAEITGDLLSGVRRIVFVVVDALGYRRLLDTLAANPQNGFHSLLRAGAKIVPLTSVFPSTTVAALTSIWTGYSPAEHGFLGYQLFLREFGVRAEMISFSPIATRTLGRDQLLQAGLAPATFLPVPSLPQTLAPAGVPVYHLIEHAFVHSGLSQVQIRGARDLSGYITSSDLWVQLRQRVEQHRDEHALFSAYWGGVDGLGHTYGPSSQTFPAEVNSLAYSFEREFLQALSPAAREGTLLLLTADHGQMDTPAERTIFLSDHPGLRSHLVMDYTGEPRAAYLYCRDGERAATRAYMQEHLGDKFLVLDSKAVLEAGLFGTGTLAPEAPYRMGDLLVLPRENYTLVENRDVHLLPGRHGGLTPDEMLVPLLAARLDA